MILFRTGAWLIIALKIIVLLGAAAVLLPGPPDQVDLAKATPALGLFVGFSFVHTLLRLGWRNGMIFIVIVFAVCTTLECLGVASGAIYGRYHYAPEVQPKAFGLVPWGTISYWRFVLYGGYCFASLFPGKRAARSWAGVARFAALGALFPAALDLVIDPVEVQRGTWIWEQSGWYFGIPLQNYFGWFITGAIALTLFRLVELRWPRPSRIGVSGFLANLPVWDGLSEGLLYLLTAISLGLFGPALAGGLALIPFTILFIRSLRRSGAQR